MITITVGGYALDEEQMEAVCSNSKYIMVVAGAGSGKTTTIIGRIKYLIQNGVDPNSILCISFTNATVESLKNKIEEEVNTSVDVYTFHKLSMNILKDSMEYKICSSNFLDYMVKEYLENIILNDMDMMYAVLRYFNLSTVKINVLKKYKRLISYKKIDRLIHLITKFIRLMKTNGYDIYSFKKFYKNKFKTKSFYFLKLVLILYQKYHNELRSMGELDFDDLIIEARNMVDKYGIKNNYKYIIIDEFQDSSMIRFSLIKSILNKTDSSLFVVGDDFQSIYKFAGCDLRIMLDFKKYFKDASIYKITNTYRNSQELIDIAGSFVMKNRNQIYKELKSNKRLEDPVKIIRYKDYKKDFKKLIEEISVKNSILVLGRNNKDIYKLLDKDYNIDSGFNIVYIPKNIKFKYMTIHKSKGLEADVVIIINLVDDIIGFPSKLEDNKILSLVSNKADAYPYSEERRLFYVGLTRTKGYVYLYTPKYNASEFVDEIKKLKKA